MNPLLKAALTFTGVTLGYVVLTCVAWGVTAYFLGDMTLEGAFLISPFLSLVFLPMFVGCVFAGYKRGELVYRQAAGCVGSPGLSSDYGQDSRLARAWFALKVASLVGSALILWYVGASWFYITMAAAAAVFVVFKQGRTHG